MRTASPMVQVRAGLKGKLSIISVMSSPSAPLVPKTQSRNGVRPVSTEARVGEQWVPPEWKSCMMMLPGCLAQASTCGVSAVPAAPATPE